MDTKELRYILEVEGKMNVYSFSEAARLLDSTMFRVRLVGDVLEGGSVRLMTKKEEGCLYAAADAWGDLR